MYAYMHSMYALECMCVMVQLWRSNDSSWELLLSVHHMRSKDKTQVVRIVSKHLYMQIHLNKL